MANTRSRGWTFTINNYTEDDLSAIRSLDCQYRIHGKEIGQSGTPHLQGYLYFTNTRSFRSLKSKLPTAHIEKAIADAALNRDYCSKDGDFEEYGEPPKTQAKKGETSIQRWTDARRAAESGRIDLIPDDLYVRYKRSFDSIRDEFGTVPDNLVHTTRHKWYYGQTGAGKSRTAREELVDYYVKDPQNSWWDGYKGEDNVVIDDFDKYNVKLSGELKRWLDIYPFNAEFKGAKRVIRPKLIIVTSNYHPDEIWAEDPQTAECIKRRVVLQYFA